MAKDKEKCNKTMTYWKWKLATCNVVVANNSNNRQFGQNEEVVVRKENLKKVPQERKNGVAI